MRIFIATLALAACTADPAVMLTTQNTPTTAADRAALAALTDQAKDPASVQFRGVRSFATSGNQRIVCGEYNARNSFGGYVGYLPFWIRTYENQPVHVVAASNATEAEVIAGKCRAAATGRVTV